MSAILVIVFVITVAALAPWLGKDSRSQRPSPSIQTPNRWSMP